MGYRQILIYLRNHNMVLPDIPHFFCETITWINIPIENVCIQEIFFWIINGREGINIYNIHNYSTFFGALLMILSISEENSGFSYISLALSTEVLYVLFPVSVIFNNSIFSSKSNP